MLADSTPPSSPSLFIFLIIFLIIIFLLIIFYLPLPYHLPSID